MLEHNVDSLISGQEWKKRGLDRVNCNWNIQLKSITQSSRKHDLDMLSLGLWDILGLI